MSAVVITQLPVPSTSPSVAGTIRVWPKTGKFNLLFNAEAYRQNDSTAAVGSQLNFALMESNTGAATDWGLISKTGTSLAATASTSDSTGVYVALAVTGNTTPIDTTSTVAVTGASVNAINGVFNVKGVTGSTTTITQIVIGLPYDSTLAVGSALGASVTKVSPITVAAGGENTASVLTQKKLVQIWGWGTTSGGYCRLDYQFNGLMFYGQIDIEVGSQKSGYGYIGDDSKGQNSGGTGAVWPQAPTT